MNIRDENFTLDRFRKFLTEQDGELHNSLCVSGAGEIYFQSWGGNDGNMRPVFPPDGFRFETFCAGNDYVGEQAARDDHFVVPLFSAVHRLWGERARGYIDCW